LRKDDGQITKDKAEMQSMARDFFKNLYTAHEEVNPTELWQTFETRISDEANISLCKTFTDKEISDALFQIGPLKALRPNGFPARFFQRDWDIMKSNIIWGVQKFFETGDMPAIVNETTIVLIPKKIEPEVLNDFRPIYLCDKIYKVVSKCLINRLRPMLQEIIEPMQSAFILGRMITDNALIVIECLHAIRNGNKGSQKFGAYKLECKAYDRVDWSFLEGVLKRFDFHHTWV
jgi:hypothetical protein